MEREDWLFFFVFSMVETEDLWVVDKKKEINYINFGSKYMLLLSRRINALLSLLLASAEKNRTEKSKISAKYTL